MNEEIDLLCFPPVTRVLGRRTDEHREIARQFGKEFFDGSRDTGYGGYVYDGRWRAVAERLRLHYNLKNMSRVLDVGCAKGFLVHDLLRAGLDAYGCDVSGYALANCVSGVSKRLFLRCATNLPDVKYSLVVSINSIHNLDVLQCAKALQEMERVGKHKYVVLDAYRTDEERERMMSWNLTAKTILHVDEWRAFFRNVGYTGDYGWFIP